MTLKKCPVLYGRGSCQASYERVMCHTSLSSGFNTGLSGAGVIQACQVSYKRVMCHMRLSGAVVILECQVLVYNKGARCHTKVSGVM